MTRKLFGPGLAGLASSREAWLVIHRGHVAPSGGQAAGWGKADLWKGTQGLTWPVALLGFRLRDGPGRRS